MAAPPLTRRWSMTASLHGAPELQYSTSSSLFPRPMPRRKKTSSPCMIRPRVYLGEDLMLGPGKVDLMKALHTTGSISAAARTLGMSYKRAWLLLETLNQGFGRPLVDTSHGGRGGGGARLTELGEEVLRLYSEMESACAEAVRPGLRSLLRLAQRIKQRG